MAQQDEQQQGGYNQNSNSIEQPSKGLYTDVAPISQPQGTYRFALNAINESEEGDMNTLTNELGNEEYAFLPIGYVPIGYVYVGDNELCIFSTNGTNSEIGLLSDKYSYDNSTVNGKKNNYRTVLNDSLSPFGKKLDFQVNKQIKAVYRLRKGCEKIVYWTDDYNVPRNINLNDISHYIEDNGHLKMNNFNIIKEVKTHIELESAKVVDYKGSLHVGGVKFMIRYVDKNKIPTKFIYESGSYNIYNSKFSDLYDRIDGAVDVGKQGDSLKGELTTKGLEIKIKHLDTEYPFFQIAFIHYTDITGIVSNIYLSDLLSTTNKAFVYTGNNYLQKSTVEELKLSQEGITIERAKTIEIKDNRLVLGNIKKKDTNFFKLQRYASKIKVDGIMKETFINKVDKHNPKHPSCNINGVGFKFGEIYSLGIVYLFEGGVESPVFHIPGKINGDTEILDKEWLYHATPEEVEDRCELFPMSFADNSNVNQKYTEREKCGSFSYWGKDYNGNILDENVNVRFHRFPTRSALDKELIRKDGNSKFTRNVYKIIADNIGISEKECKDLGGGFGNCFKNGDKTYTVPVNVTVYYSLNGENKEITKTKDEIFNNNGVILEVETENEEESDRKLIIKDIILSYEKGKIEITTTTITTTTIIPKTCEREVPDLDDQGVQKKDPQGNPLTKKEQYACDEEKTETTVKKTYNIISNSGIPLTADGDFNYTGLEKTVISTNTVTSGDNKNGSIVKKEVISVGTKNIIPKSEDGIPYTGEINAFKAKERNYSFQEYIHSVVDGNDLFYMNANLRINKEEFVDSSVSYKNTILGIHLSDVELPTKDVTGLNCIGYYVVKQEIKEKDKTILDSCVLLPTIKYQNFTASSLLDPQIIRKRQFYKPDGLSDTVFNVIAMKNRFRGNMYDNFNELVLEGYYKVNERTEGGFYIQDILDFKEGKNNSGAYEDDNDGTDLKCVLRDSRVEYIKDYTSHIPKENIEIDFNNPYTFNYSETTKEYICHMDLLNTGLFFTIKDFPTLYKGSIGDMKYPFGYLKNSNRDFYNDYRTAFYEKLHSEFASSERFSSFNGDCFLGGYRHTTNSYLTTTPRLHVEKGDATNFLKAVAGAVLIVVGLVFTGGTLSTVGGMLLAAAVGSAVAYGTYSLITGVIGMIKQAEFNKITGELYEKGLKNTFGDDLFFRSFVDALIGSPQNGYTRESSGGNDNNQIPFQDNAMLYYSQVLGDFIFESDFNFALRVNKSTERGDDFIKPFSERMPYRYNNVNCHIYNTDSSAAGTSLKDSINNIVYKSDESCCRYGVTQFGKAFHNCEDDGLISIPIDNNTYKYFLNKICKVKPERKMGYEYAGISQAITYIANRDYSVTENIKKYTMIPFEYTICSECIETFPQRFYWSEKDFVESVNDSFTRWLPNNYKDISGEYGDIVNIFDFNGRLYIHTTEGLWMQPTNYQERITDGVVSYIGTGEFGSLPAQLIINDKNGNSAGLQHKEATVMTPYGYFFISEKEGTIYKFDGKLTPISEVGISKWFDENINVELEGFYRGTVGEEYEYKDNPANIFGTGFILIWDKEHQRILVTKKDFKFKNEELNGSQTKVVLDKNEVYYVGDFKNIVKALKSVFASELKKNTLKDMLFLDSRGKIVQRDDIEENISLKYEGIRNKRLVFSGFSNNLNSFVFGYVSTKKIENVDYNDLSWTLSYSLKTNTWTSYHSYRPAMYFRMNNNFYSYENEIKDNPIFLHNFGNKYQTFYGKFYPYIVEYVSNDNPIINKIYNHLRIITNAYKYSEEQREYYEQRYITFNKAVMYNTRQCSGIVNLKVKNLSDMNAYTIEQVVNTNDGVVLIDNNEGDWLLNDLRDYIVKYDKPFFNSNKITVSERNNNEFIDKLLEDGTTDLNKSWGDLESFRSKFLVIRLIFDNFADVKLVLNFTSENVNVSNY